MQWRSVASSWAWQLIRNRIELCVHQFMCKGRDEVDRISHDARVVGDEGCVWVGEILCGDVTGFTVLMADVIGKLGDFFERDVEVFKAEQALHIRKNAKGCSVILAAFGFEIVFVWKHKTGWRLPKGRPMMRDGQIVVFKHPKAQVLADECGLPERSMFFCG